MFSSSFFNFDSNNLLEPMQFDTMIDEVYDSNVQCNLDMEYEVDSAPFEVETYASQYTGYGKLMRLLYIADHCPQLEIDALDQAIKYIKASTYDFNSYIKIQNRLSELLQANGELNIEPLDKNWIENQKNLAQETLDKLEIDLKNYKANSITESIRRGYDDLGLQHLQCGDLNMALKSFTRSREYCLGDSNLFNICFNVIKLNIYLQNWPIVNSFIQKAMISNKSENLYISEETQKNEKSKSKKEKNEDSTKINCLAGLHELATRKYNTAADNLVRVKMDDTHQLTDILSANNVAIYGGLCALASYNREELRRKVLQCADFKLFLELEPQLREAIIRFMESKYPDCLKLLDELKDAFMLDIYLAPHVKPLYKLIRSRAMIQYFTPYISTNLHLMASAFNTTVAELEEELMRLILDGKIQARIDSHNKILYAKDMDPRLLAFDNVMKKGREWQMKATSMILRAACARHGMIVLRNLPATYLSFSNNISSMNNLQQNVASSNTNSSASNNEINDFSIAD